MSIDVSGLSDALAAVVSVGAVVFGIRIGKRLYRWLKDAIGSGGGAGRFDSVREYEDYLNN